MIAVNGRAARLVDLSEGGARMRLGVPQHKGDRVKIELPWGRTVFAYVVEAEDNFARVCFEELVGPAKKEAAPAK
jgi:hypothetical protein